MRYAVSNDWVSQAEESQEEEPARKQQMSKSLRAPPNLNAFTSFQNLPACR
jgi:hypothetical protein